MKKYLLLMLVALTGIVTSCNYDDDELWGSVNDLANRVSAMESLTKQKNSDIAAMQAIINGLENQVPVSEVENLTDGYILHFTDGTSVTIKNGKDGKDGIDGEDGKNGANGKDGKDGADGENGKDGANGKDGKDGKDGKNAPSIFVDQENGVWYWTITINGETKWLTDDKGRKIEVVNKGSMDGADGNNGVTPLLDTEKGDDGNLYWVVSTNNGISYTRITFEGKDLVAQDSADDKKGDKGDRLFDDVIINGDIVEITAYDESGERIEFELLFQKSVIFYNKEGIEVNTKNTPLNGAFAAEYTFKLELDNAKFEVVADDGVDINVCGIGTSGAVDYNNMTVSINIDGELSEARAVILFFSENKTITSVFKFNISPWDGKTVQAVTPNANGEYEINFPAELAWIAQKVNKGESFAGKTIKLMYDIDLAGQRWTPIGTLVYPFKGRFDGNGKVVKNLNVGSGVMIANTRATQSRAAGSSAGVGMFGVAENATFENITISNAQTNSSLEGAAGILVGVTSGTTSISGVTIENASATATGTESAAGLLVGKATGSISISNVNINSTEEETNTNKVEAAYSGGIVGHVAAENVEIQDTKVEGLDLGINAENGEAAAGGAVLGKIEPATEDGSINLTITGAEVESVKLAVSSESTNGNAANVSVGAVAGAISNAGNANIKIEGSTVTDVKVETETEEAASSINQGTVLGNLNEVMETNPEAGAEILENNTVDSSVEIKNQMKIESLNAMFENLEWNMEEYSFDIDGEIQGHTTLIIPNNGYAGKLNLNFKKLATSINSVFNIRQDEYGTKGMVVNLQFDRFIEDQFVNIDMGDATVNLLSGQFEKVTSITAANTLNIKDGVTVKSLYVIQGNIGVIGSGKITGSIINQTNGTVYVSLQDGATAKNNLPAEENIGKNIEISETIVITNTELARGLAELLGRDKVSIDENGYGILRTEVAETVTQLDFRWRGFQITNIKGLEYFTKLEDLYLDGYLTEFDSSKLTSLRKLVISFCSGLKHPVDFSKNTNLEHLEFRYIYYVPEINLSGCNKLIYLDLAGSRSLSTMDFGVYSNLTYLCVSDISALTTLDVTKLSKLENLNVSNTSLSDLDLSKCNNLKVLNVGNTSISELNMPNPQLLTTLESDNNKSLTIDWNRFTGLTYLSIDQMNLENLDFIPNKVRANLLRLDCNQNQLQHIDLSLYSNLTSLSCYNNILRSLNVAGAKSLIELYCERNNLKTLDVSSLKNLQYIYCGDQQDVLTLTISESQKQLWTERWKNSNSGVHLDSEIIKDPEAETGGNGFGNGGKI